MLKKKRHELYVLNSMLRGFRLLASMFSEVTVVWAWCVWVSMLPNSVDPKLRDVYLVPADFSFPFFSF